MQNLRTTLCVGGLAMLTANLTHGGMEFLFHKNNMKHDEEFQWSDEEFEESEEESDEIEVARRIIEHLPQTLEIGLNPESITWEAISQLPRENKNMLGEAIVSLNSFRINEEGKALQLKLGLNGEYFDKNYFRLHEDDYLEAVNRGKIINETDPVIYLNAKSLICIAYCWAIERIGEEYHDLKGGYQCFYRAKNLMDFLEQILLCARLENKNKSPIYDLAYQLNDIILNFYDWRNWCEWAFFL